jgi:hypothetical protein
MLRNALWVVLACATLVCGCGKKNEPVSEAPKPEAAPARQAEAGADTALDATPSNVSPVAEKPLPPPPPAVAARADNVLRPAVIGDVDPFLTSQLRDFVSKQGRLPESFSEFATLRLDSIPRPPAGKKWVIDVAGMQVKAVSTK